MTNEVELLRVGRTPQELIRYRLRIPREQGCRIEFVFTRNSRLSWQVGKQKFTLSEFLGLLRTEDQQMQALAEHVSLLLKNSE